MLGHSIGTSPCGVQVISQEEAEALQQQGQLLLSETACSHMYGITKAAVQAVQYQDKVSLFLALYTLSSHCSNAQQEGAATH